MEIWMTVGIDLGNTSVKLAALDEGGNIIFTEEVKHHGRWREELEALLRRHPELHSEKAALTGSFSREFSELEPVGDIPAIEKGASLLAPEARSVIEIGSLSARYLTGLGKGLPPEFAVNEHCAGGTGSFFEDQMSRLGMNIEDFSEEVMKAKAAPRLSGRCAVFAKTDIIHRQQEGHGVPEILLGLCYAMVRNYKAVIVKGLPEEKPIALLGGISRNRGVVKAVNEVFSAEAIVPEHAVFAAAAGAALIARERETTVGDVLRHRKAERAQSALSTLARTVSPKVPEPSRIMPEEGCFIGIDIGSTSTDLLLSDRNGNIIDYLYLRTAGNPEGALRHGLSILNGRYGDIRFLGAGITGSGRERLGKLFNVDVVRDEITAQAKAASTLFPDADTVFEIGGQDSKYISLENGVIKDFQMNKICAAGTGSFVEEIAARLSIPLDDFGLLALQSKAPADLGERCTVFMSTAIDTELAEGASLDDIAAGVCFSIVRNYLHKTVGSKRIGDKIILQGGVAYNPGIIAAFRAVSGRDVEVSPIFPVSGSYGAALLAAENWKEGTVSSFGSKERKAAALSAEIERNKKFYDKPMELLLQGYDGKRDPSKKTVGIPFALVIHKFFPLANAFFKALGFNVLLTDPTNEETIAKAQEYAEAETCYPVKLLYGHMRQLVEAKVDYIFLPRLHTMKHECSHVAHNYGCVFLQSSAAFVAESLRLKEKGITLLSPLFDLDMGQPAMGMAMLSTAKQLGIAQPLAAPAMMKGGMAMKKSGAAVEAQGKELLESLKGEDKVLVMITRNYGVSDPVLNMGIPQLLLERGCKVITLSHLPAHDLDIHAEYPNLFWPFGQHIISGAKMIKSHPNLYAVYLTDHGCGPDTMLSHMFREVMGDKPYLEIEVDEHASAVGVITRIEAFLESLKGRKAEGSAGFDNLLEVPLNPTAIKRQPERTLSIPELGLYSEALAAYYGKAYGIKTELSGDREKALRLGKAETDSKEYLSFVLSLGRTLEAAQRHPEGIEVLVPENEGADADGEYSKTIESILRASGIDNRVTLVSPMLEHAFKEAKDSERLMNAILYTDVVYSAPASERERLRRKDIPSWDEILKAAEEVSELQSEGKRIGVLGAPELVYSEAEMILKALEEDGWDVVRMPLSEYLAAASEENNSFLGKRNAQVSKALKARSPFTDGPFEEHPLLPRFAGGNGTYRLSKQERWDVDAVLTVSPRYENTETVLEIATHSKRPVFHLALDGDKDEGLWSRLSSFLYYIR